MVLNFLGWVITILGIISVVRATVILKKNGEMDISRIIILLVSLIISLSVGITLIGS
mgnify:CR=1 FL=1